MFNKVPGISDQEPESGTYSVRRGCDCVSPTAPLGLVALAKQKRDASQICATGGSLLERVGRLAASLSRANYSLTATYSVARSLLALASASTLAFSASDSLFRPGVGNPFYPNCSTAAQQLGLFCQLPAHPAVARWLAVAGLLVVASGWRPRWTGVIHWWLTFSFVSNALLVDGGDQLASNLTFLLIPVTLGDSRRWHWTVEARSSKTPNTLRLVGVFATALVRLQVAAVYFHAAVGKMAVSEWRDGTALYYWLTHNTFGAPAWLLPIVRPLLLWGPSLSAMTWSVILLEYLLSLAFLFRTRPRQICLVAGLLFHAGIAMVNGLLTFSLAMEAALLLYLQEKPLDLVRVGGFATGRLLALRGVRGVDTVSSARNVTQASFQGVTTGEPIAREGSMESFRLI